MSNINESDITLRPVDVFYGDREKFTVLCVADSSGSLNNTYWEFQNTDIDGNTTDYYVWYNVNSAGTDPALANKTGVEVALATDAAATTVASTTETALSSDATIRVSSSVSSATVTVEMGAMGSVTDASDSGSTGFTITEVLEGQKFEFGATDDVNLTPSFNFVDVTASQLGETLLDQIQNGNNITVTVPAKEVVAALFEETLGEVAGDKEVVGSDTIIGIGESQRFQNMKARSKELFLRPANETDLTNAWAIWSARPDLTGLNFSGSELQVLELEFNAYRDSDRPQTVSLAAFGKSDKGMLA